jgi:hypothetical protein
MGFDQLMARYDHFTVESSMMKATPFNDGTTHLTPAHAGIWLADSQSAIDSAGDTLDVMESTLRVGNLLVGCGWANQGYPQSIIARFDAKKFFGTSPLGKSQYRGSSSSNPTEGAYFSIFACAENGNTPGNLQFLVELEYIVTFSERARITGS